MDNKKTKNGHSAIKLAAIGVTLAAAAAGAYFFFGPKGKKHRNNAKAWAIKMKADVIEKLEKARDAGEETYLKIIDSVAAEYKKRKKAGKEEIDELSADLKKHWKTIKEQVAGK